MVWGGVDRSRATLQCVQQGDRVGADGLGARQFGPERRLLARSCADDRWRRPAPCKGPAGGLEGLETRTAARRRPPHDLKRPHPYRHGGRPRRRAGGSAESRVGQECVRKCISRWSAYTEKKQKKSIENNVEE